MRHILLFCLLTLSSLRVTADGLGFEAGASLWRTDITGLVDASISDGTYLAVDLEENLTMASANNYSYYLTFYHPLPYLPNLTVAASNIEHKGRGNPDASDISNIFDPVPLALAGTLDISHRDITLYWTPLDIMLFALDAGLTYRKFEGKMHFSFTPEGSDSYTLSSKLDNHYLLVYGKFSANLPLTGLSAHFKLNAGNNFDNKNPQQAFDMDLGISYRNFTGLGVGAGFRYFDVDLESNVLTTKATYKLDTYGPYLSLSYRL